MTIHELTQKWNYELIENIRNTANLFSFTNPPSTSRFSLHRTQKAKMKTKNGSNSPAVLMSFFATHLGGSNSRTRPTQASFFAKANHKCTSHVQPSNIIASSPPKQLGIRQIHNQKEKFQDEISGFTSCAFYIQGS